MCGGWGASRPPTISPFAIAAILTVERRFVDPVKASGEEQRLGRHRREMTDGVYLLTAGKAIEHERTGVGADVRQGENGLRIIAPGQLHRECLVIHLELVAEAPGALDVDW